MSTEKFRRELRQEAEQWWQEGLIDAGLYERLCERYQLRSLEGDASQRFTAILLGLGSILLGLAAITFVAANWQVWPRPVRLALLLGLFWAVNAAGFYLWRKPASRSQRFGHGLLLMGGLLLGANLGLMSQMFHQSGQLYALFWVWGLGVVVMAYGLRLASLGVLAWVLLQLGYWLGWSNSLWGGSLSDSAWSLAIQHMPLVTALLFVPLAYRCRSRWLFWLASGTVAMSISMNTLSLFNSSESAMGWAVPVAFLLPPALLWSYSSSLWRRASDPFVPIARSLALWCLGISFSLFAFQAVWETAKPDSVGFTNWHLVADVIVLIIVTGLGWFQIAQESRQFQSGRHFDRLLHSGTIAGMLLLAFGLLYCSFNWVTLGSLGVLASNLLLFGLAIGLIRDGLALGSRGAFWGGMGLLVLDIICRMLEYNTGLLLKSLVFALCGIGIIAAGIWFERNSLSSHASTHRSTEEKPL
ncbi:MAG: DUF2157 domain-containing protein [Pegethrix bostrychoides GSE-TBD4-15B]|jgi:uncharacterized membrane protein|uniref:DUF2157 domain-containing protein n=1 Tax=Pegethrix bostrychoides GSE-TBD4-15B TaxID=2839662 RepID=A0A951P859_9CYAN|nr:DUF2157 domain-containing protein [Pegethrix bostrychoides GSE-TBD4-15B]